MRSIEEEIEDYIQEMQEVMSLLPKGTLKEIIKILFDAYQNGKQVFTMANGGPASTASHWAQGLLRYPIISEKKDRVVIKKRLRAYSLCNDVATLTGWANDLGYKYCFSEQLGNLLNEGDVVIGFTGSGHSKNILEAFKKAKKMGAITICFSGATGGKAKEIADITFLVPTDNPDLVEDIHVSLGHFCCKVLSRMIRKKVGDW